jgi:FdhD protein
MALPESVIITAMQYAQGSLTPIELNVSAEYPITLSINDNPYVVIACSGSDLEMLAIGHLITEGIITSKDEIRELAIDTDSLKINIVTEQNDAILERLFRIHSIASGCGHGRSETPTARRLTAPTIMPEVILTCMKTFLHASELHKKTRGVHSAALYSADGKELVFFDEIGRHNAIDKIIGYANKNRVSLSDKLIFSTGRMSSEIIYKLLYATAPVIISKASPTSLAIDLARRYNIVMIGKVTGNSLCIFNGEEKIAL